MPVSSLLSVPFYVVPECLHVLSIKKMQKCVRKCVHCYFAYLNGLDVRCCGYEFVVRLIALQINGYVVVNVLLYSVKYSTHRKAFDMKVLYFKFYIQSAHNMTLLERGVSTELA